MKLTSHVPGIWNYAPNFHAVQTLRETAAQEFPYLYREIKPCNLESLADVIINDSHSVIIVRSVCLVFSFTQWLQVPVWYLAPPWVNWIPLQSVVYLLIIADGGDLCDVIQLAEGFCYTRKLQMPLSLTHV